MTSTSSFRTRPLFGTQNAVGAEELLYRPVPIDAQLAGGIQNVWKPGKIVAPTYSGTCRGVHSLMIKCAGSTKVNNEDLYL